MLRGRAHHVQEVADAIIGTRGVIHGKLVCTAVAQPSPDHDEEALGA